MSKKDKKQKGQGYILRYYLPVSPNFDTDYTEKRFCELLEFCEKAKIDAVMFFVALAPDFYYMPDTPEYAQKWRDIMLPYIKRLKDAKISYQLNFQNTMGATTKGLDFSEIYGWENLVDQTGRESKGCACPLGKKFREQTEKRLRIWAETEPDIIWLDDDFRLHNHGTPLGAVAEGKGGYADFYCYCDAHLKLFNEKNNTDYTRETLVKAMLEIGEPSDIRKKYLEFLSDTMTETAAWMENVIHKASPKTKIALMTSRPDTHAAEGRNWNPFLTALCGEYPPILRPTFGPYKDQEQPIKDFVNAYQQLGMLKAQMREAELKNIEYCPEVENTQFTIWSKSTMATSFQLALSAFLGCSDITLSIYDLDGGAFSDEPLYENMLAVQKPFLDKVVSLELEDAKELGIAIPVSANSGKNYRLKSGEVYEDIGGKSRYIEKYFLQMGVLVKFISPNELENSDIIALDGYSAGFLSDEQIRIALSKSVFLEGNAASVLHKRGFGDLIGVTKISDKSKTPAQAEEILIDFKRDDGTEIRIPTRISVHNRYEIKASDKAEIITNFVTPLGDRETGLMFFENKNGGRIVIYPAADNWSSAFFNHSRVALFKKILRKLDPGMIQVDCASYSLVVVKEKANGERYYFLSNLSPSPTKEFNINGQKIEIELGIFQSAVYEEFDGKITFLGKSEICH